MNLEWFLRRAFGWLRPVRSLLHSWPHEIRRPLSPHGVVPEVRQTQAGVQVLVATIATDTPSIPTTLPVDQWSRGILADTRRDQLEHVLHATAELVGEMARHASTDVAVLTESTQPGAPGVLGTGPVSHREGWG
jgi:hypothetical protein